MTGQLQEALKMISISHKINTEIKEDRHIANDLNHLAMIYQQIGGSENLELSIKYYREATQLNYQLISKGYRNRKFNLANNLGGLGISLSKLARKSDAHEQWIEAIKLFEEVGAFERVKYVESYMATSDADTLRYIH